MSCRGSSSKPLSPKTLPAESKPLSHTSLPLPVFSRVRVANELGAGNAEGAKFATVVSVFTSLLVGLFFWALIIAIPDKLAMIFTSSISVTEMVSDQALLLAFTVLLNCIQPVFSGVAVGSGWQAWVAFINMGSYYAVGVPFGVILGLWLGFGFQGIWVGMIFGTVVQTLILAFFTSRCNRDKEAENACTHMPIQAATEQ